MGPLRQIDWKVLVFAWLGCYLVPWFVFGSLIEAAVGTEGVIEGALKLLVSSYAVLYLIVMPVAAGYFTARFSRNRPQLHVLLVASVAAAAFALISSSSSISMRGVMFVASVLFASLGAFVALRRGRRREA